MRFVDFGNWFILILVRRMLPLGCFQIDSQRFTVFSDTTAVVSLAARCACHPSITRGSLTTVLTHSADRPSLNLSVNTYHSRSSDQCPSQSESACVTDVIVSAWTIKPKCFCVHVRGNRTWRNHWLSTLFGLVLIWDTTWKWSISTVIPYALLLSYRQIGHSFSVNF